MSGDTELPWLWPWPALLLLGTVTGLCVRCSHPGVKKTGKIYQQRNLQENNQSFQVAQTYSLVRQVWPGPLTDVTPPDPSSPRYQNFSKGSQRKPDATYIDLLAADYYNWGHLQKSQEVIDASDDSNSYENVLICRPRAPGPAGTQAREERGDPPSPPCPSGGEESDYQNSTSIHQWRKSAKAVGQAQGAESRVPAGSPEDDDNKDEPDYVNA